VEDVQALTGLEKRYQCRLLGLDHQTPGGTKHACPWDSGADGRDALAAPRRGPECSVPRSGSARGLARAGGTRPALPNAGRDRHRRGREGGPRGRRDRRRARRSRSFEAETGPQKDSVSTATYSVRESQSHVLRGGVRGFRAGGQRCPQSPPRSHGRGRRREV